MYIVIKESAGQKIREKVTPVLCNKRSINFHFGYIEKGYYMVLNVFLIKILKFLN